MSQTRYAETPQTGGRDLDFITQRRYRADVLRYCKHVGWMRPLRFTLFLAVLAGLLSAAGYLWAPLVGPSAPHLRFSTPALHWRVLPLRINAVSPPNRSELHSLPLRVDGSFLVHRRHPEPNQVSLPVSTPTAVSAR